MKMEWFSAVWLVWAAMVAAAAQGTAGCVQRERMGLIELRKAMPPNQLTAPPVGSDCCLWDGVHCSAATGRVQTLTFSPVDRKYWGYFLNISLFLPFEELWQLKLDRCHFDGLINQADLEKLTRLEMLSISGNNLSNIMSLQDFANMRNLKYLDLMDNHITIINLTGICEMKNIIALYLRYNNIRGHLPRCIGNLTYLQILDISSNQISGVIPSTIGNLSRLSSLYLQENYLSGSFSLHLLANNSNLKALLLSNMYNDFQLETETQSWFPSFQLSSLNLRSSNLNIMSHSIIPTFLLHQSELRFIDLSDNKLQDTFPSWLLQNNSKLELLLMSNNSFTGNLNLPNSIHGLTAIGISNNKIGGKLPDNLQLILPALQLLFLSKNRFEGNLPPFGALKRLRQVNLSFNLFSGKLPKTLFANNTDLLEINFSNNLLDGEIYINLTTLPSLSILDLSNNKFNGSVEELPSSPLEVFDLSNNLISGKLTKSLGDFSSLQVLIVSNNSFEGGIPDKLCDMSKLIYLDISHNNFSGLIPSCWTTSSISFLYMRNCSLSGVLPNELFFNSTLIALDLSYNDFSHSVLPNWIFQQHNLQILLMAGIQLEGEISTQLCRLENIKIMDLSHNNFNNSIPSCLFKRPFWVDESQGDYINSIPLSFPVFYLIPSKNGLFEVEFTTKGRPIRFQGSILNLMNGLDVSSNKLSGQIPPQIGDSKAIRALNLSNNRLWGSIPITISGLRKIESLNLSSNNLSGEIPSEIVRLNFLSTFNVSNNNLSGPIPIGGQFSNFDEQNYGGNEFLFGPLLHRPCTTSPSLSTPLEEQDNDDETIFERASFWWSFIAAYVAVVISVVVVVGIDTRCSGVWLRAVDVVCSKLFYVFAKLKFILGIK